MEITELRMGNHVQQSGEMFKVSLTTFGELMCHDDIYQPILLTEDILLKCGFEKGEDSDFTYFKLNGVEFTDISPSGYELSYYESTPMLHLHQLQNLYFALTGEELTFQEV